MASTLKVKLRDDGSVKLDASKMIGKEAELIAQLEALAAEIGGDLTIEAHREGVHHHHHGDGKYHEHN